MFWVTRFILESLISKKRSVPFRLISHNRFTSLSLVSNNSSKSFGGYFKFKFTSFKFLFEIPKDINCFMALSLLDCFVPLWTFIFGIVWWWSVSVSWSFLVQTFFFVSYLAAIQYFFRFYYAIVFCLILLSLLFINSLTDFSKIRTKYFSSKNGHQNT